MPNNPTIRSLILKFQLQAYILALLWTAGLLVGILLSTKALIADHLLIANVIAKKPSVFGLFLCYLPVGVCIIGILNDSYFINCTVVVIMSLFRGFCGFLFFVHYGSGAWLIRSLVLFSSELAAVFMWWFLFRFYIYGHTGPRKNFYLVTFFMFLFGLVDQLLLSPFLMRLSVYF